MKKIRQSMSLKSRIKLLIAGFILSFLMPVFVCASENLNTQTVTATFRNTTLTDVIWELQKQTDFTFMYSTNDVQAVKVSNLSVVEEEVTKVLDKCLENTNLSYTIKNDVVVIKKSARASNASSAQQQKKHNITGSVVDANKEPLMGVNILVKGTNQGAISDLNGNFLLTTNYENVTLLASFIGFATSEISAQSGENVRIVLKEDDMILDEVIVTGYGMFKKSAFAGSASVIKTEKLENVPVLSVNDLLLGNASGLTVTSGSCVPGAPNIIRIRGVGSFNASKSPLYVIDGIPVMSGNISEVPSASSNAAGLDVFNSINASDIESVAIVKDAAAASLYGSRAANGVIIITTKSGKKGKALVNLKADMGFSDFAMPYRTIMSGQERRDLIWEGLYNEYLIKGGEVTNAANYTDAVDYAEKEIDKYAPVPWNGFADWDAALFRIGSYQNYEASISGGTDNMRYFSSFNHRTHEGVTYNSGLKRISARLNIEWNASEKFTIGVKALFSDIHQDVFSEGTVYTSPFYSSRNAVSPSDPVYLEDGNYNRSFIRNSDRNPKLSMDYNFKHQNLTRAFNTVYAQYDFMPDLEFKTVYSYDYNLSKADTYDDPRTSDGRNSKGARIKRFREYKKWVWSNSLAYDLNFLENHYLDILSAFDLESYTTDYLNGSTKNFAVPDLNAISNGAETTYASGFPSAWRMASFISRVNYNYKSKYYLGASLRYDGSSRLSPVDNNRWGAFWSISGAWRFTDEAFADNLKNIIQDAKLRLSYGTNGTLPSDYYGYLSLNSLSSSYTYMDAPGVAADQIPNEKLKWESNYNLNLGLDMSFFGRIAFSLEYYNRITKDLLQNFPISMTTGFGYYLKNVGEVRNTGFELELTTQNIKANNFNWTTGFNIGHNKNEILKWDGIVTESVSGDVIRRIGLPYYTYYLYEFAGINPEDGMPEFYKNTTDERGNIIDRSITKDIKEAERIAYKSFEPKVSGGLSNTFLYKWIDLNFLLTYSFGGYTYDNGAHKAEHGGSDIKANIPSYYSESWQKPGDNTNIERFVANREMTMANIPSTRRVHSSDHIRLKNITFGIKLPQKWINPLALTQVRIYISGSNLLTWAKWDFYDPEAAEGDGFVAWTQPPLKTWTFGLDIKL